MALTKQAYTEHAYDNAFGDQGDDWLPERGYDANRPRILKLYDYYRDTFNRAPDSLLWAGLGRMAGGAVVSGLDLLSRLQGSIGPIQNEMVAIGKAIFDDMAWLHEAWLDDPVGTVELAREHDIPSPARRSYASALEAINEGNPQSIAAGNAMLLEIEQFSIIQPH